ncbi:MAG: LuxR family transcriptional regulator [Bacteroidetes bacterium]|nr:MAG: LuxR family transcriptional regulator [Bacteroidota bacterium]
MKSVIQFIYFVCLVVPVLSFAQELPPIQTFTASDYNAENQNWDISQAENKYIYIANNKGLLEFNGAKWKLYSSPNETIMRSVLVKNERVYTGCYMEFGYWEYDEYNELIYTSLSNKIYKDLIEDEQFWKILAYDDLILFQSLNRIYIYNVTDSTFNYIDSETIIRKMYMINNIVYFQKEFDGIYSIINGKANLVTNHEIIKTNEVVNIFFHEEKLLIQTKEKGFYVLTDSGLNQWNISANNILNTVTVYNSIQLSDKSFALGTISNGVIHLTQDGNINYQINQIKGLSNNTVLALFEDYDKNIWLGLDNGINCVNISSPFKIYSDDRGELGTIYASKIFKNNLYLGTNQGLFVKPINSNNEFEFVNGTKGQVWCLVIYDNTLFCGHNSGTFIVNDNNASLVSDVQGTWDIKPIDENKDLLLQGNYDGLNVLKKEKGSWGFRNHINGFNISSKYFERYKSNQIFVSHEYKGVFKLNLDNDFYNVLNIIIDSSVSIGVHSNLIKYKNEILYSYKEGIFKYDDNQSFFKYDSLYSDMFQGQEFTSGKLIPDDINSRLWSFSNNSINYIGPGKSANIASINRIALPKSLRKEMEGYENISLVSDNKYLIGTSTGYISFDMESIENKKHDISINTIAINLGNNSVKKINKTDNGIFENKENNIEFGYSVPEFEKYLETEYQFQLEGIYDNWSNWSSQSSELFKNLPYGNYTFNVRARVGNSITTNIASYSFNIKKPWYLSITMVFSYAMLFIMFSLLMHNIYKRYYTIQRQKLIQKSDNELELKKLENKQQLMSFENQRLKQAMESKNSELAISTMSLIKKNEFLSTIKKELTQINNEDEIKPIIKLIDKNLNNTDDWKLFEEAFNNADKDFLKKIKSKHKSLSPNDLRLCAYLRLNLSSKEIAPLLNISHRSVEVKRYRLRKKMELQHEISLTNYILEL